MDIRKLACIGVVIASWFGVARTADATFIITLNRANVIGSPSAQVYDITGTIKNTDSYAYTLDSESFVSAIFDAAGDSMKVGEMPGLAAGPVYIPANGQYSGTLLTLEVNPNQPAGPYGTGVPSSGYVAVATFYGSALDPYYHYSWEEQDLIYAQVTETPEPATVSLFAVASGAMLLRRRRPN